MATIGTEEPQAIAVPEAIRGGDLEALRRLLAEHPRLATARLGDDDPGGMSRTLLHVVTDWPGHFPKRRHHRRGAGRRRRRHRGARRRHRWRHPAGGRQSVRAVAGGPPAG